LHVLVDDVNLVTQLRPVFRSRLWLEIIRPPRSAAHERALLELGQRLGLRPVASVAAHFATPEQHDLFRLVTAVRQGVLADRLPPRLPVLPAHHLADSETIHQRFRDLPEAVINTELLAERCRSDVLPRGVVLPNPPKGTWPEASEYLRHLCREGLKRRHLSDPEAACRRLEHELSIIHQRDLAGYFLVVRTIAADARQRNYSMALRGSAGNSLVCYLLGITDVDPLRFDLPLERFLHAGRPDLPDIDLDFDWRERDDVIARVFARHGAAHTAMISSHLFLQPRSAFREAARVHGLSNEQVSQLLGTLSDRVHTLCSPESADPAWALERLPPRFPLEPQRWPRLLADARRLLNRPHHLSVHPGGVVITPESIEQYVPLQRAAKGVVITQFEKDAVEHIGLVKIDLLGNRALSTVAEVRRHLIPLGPEAVCAPRKDADPDTIALLRRGDTLGVGQLESPAMRQLLVQMQPRGAADVIQALALIRPGAASAGAKELFVRRRRGLEPVRHFHPHLEPVLRDTCGLMLYEDDALRVVQALTGYPASEADRFRKAVAKCAAPDESETLANTFLRDCARNGVDRAAAEIVWEQLAKFNQYSFCKSHAVSYGLIAWEAAWHKAHYPVCFWVAALNNNQSMYPLRVYAEAIKRAGIPLLLPCVNRSGRRFTVEGDGIRTGLGVIRGLEESACTASLDERKRRDDFRDLSDFRRRVRLSPQALAALIRVGAFDFTGQPRASLMLEAALGDDSESTPLLPPGGEPCLYGWQPPDYSRGRQWCEEWRHLGFLVGPPVMQFFRKQLPAGLDDSRDVPGLVGRPIRLAGLVATSRYAATRQGGEVLFVTLEDEWGLAEVTIHPGVGSGLAYPGMGPYTVAGTVEDRYGVPTVTATHFERAELEDRTGDRQRSGHLGTTRPDQNHDGVLSGNEWHRLGNGSSASAAQPPP
jgi:DNA-directed DNA polymerase III PolC